MGFDGSLALELIGTLWLLVLFENVASCEGRHDLSIDGVLKSMPRDGCHLRSRVIGRFGDSLIRYQRTLCSGTECSNLESTCSERLMFPATLWTKLLIDMINRENPETYVQ